LPHGTEPGKRMVALTDAYSFCFRINGGEITYLEASLIHTDVEWRASPFGTTTEATNDVHLLLGVG
jgi:hypothetical protein